MSLRTDYTGAYDTKLAEARAAGRDNVLVTNLAAITSAMATAATAGNSTFTVTVTVGYQPQDIRTAGNLWSAFKSGMEEALSSEDIMSNEVSVTLNTSDSIATQVDLNFTF